MMTNIFETGFKVAAIKWSNMCKNWNRHTKYHFSMSTNAWDLFDTRNKDQTLYSVQFIFVVVAIASPYLKLLYEAKGIFHFKNFRFFRSPAEHLTISIKILCVEQCTFRLKIEFYCSDKHKLIRFLCFCLFFVSFSQKTLSFIHFVRFSDSCFDTNVHLRAVALLIKVATVQSDSDGCVILAKLVHSNKF